MQTFTFKDFDKLFTKKAKIPFRSAYGMLKYCNEFKTHFACKNEVIAKSCHALAVLVSENKVDVITFMQQSNIIKSFVSFMESNKNNIDYSGLGRGEVAFIHSNISKLKFANDNTVSSAPVPQVIIIDNKALFIDDLASNITFLFHLAVVFILIDNPKINIVWACFSVVFIPLSFNLIKSFLCGFYPLLNNSFTKNNILSNLKISFNYGN